jgi:molybdopterin synthase sulfur carrier subunit
MTLRQLFNELESRFPGIKKKVLRSAAVTVNLEYVDLDLDFGEDVEGEGEGEGEGREKREVVIRGGDEVGIIPPVSSG